MIIGQMKEDGYYLIDLGMQTLSGQQVRMGQVYYEEDHILYPPTVLVSLQTRDPWEAYTGSQDVLAQWQKNATLL